MTRIDPHTSHSSRPGSSGSIDLGGPRPVVLKEVANCSCKVGNLSLRYSSMALPRQPPLAHRNTDGMSTSHAAVAAPCLIKRRLFQQGSFPSSDMRIRTYLCGNRSVGKNTDEKTMAYRSTAVIFLEDELGSSYLSCS